MSVAALGVRRRPRLAFSSLLWRVSLLFMGIGELALWVNLHRLPIPPGKRVLAFVFYSPGILCSAFGAAAVVTVVSDLIVRAVIGSIVTTWLNPKVDPDALNFHVAVGEVLLVGTPARRKAGRLWPTGTLLRTDRRVGFVPTSWNQEPWIVPVAEVESVGTVPAPRLFLGFVKGVPDRVVLRTKSGEDHHFAVADPDAVRDGLCPTRGSLVDWIG